MLRTLWCVLCSTGYASVAGDIPAVCPACDKPARWSTLRPIGAPLPEYQLTREDRRFLKSLRIRPD